MAAGTLLGAMGILSWPPRAPDISDGVLTLRAWNSDDADAVYSACQDPDIQRWLDIPVPFTQSDAAAFITDQACQWSSRRGVGFAITRSMDGAVLGSCTLGNIDAMRLSANVTCAIDSSARRQRVAERALGLLCDWAFHALGLGRLEFYVEPENAVSRRLVQRLRCRSENPPPDSRPVTARGREQMLFVLQPTR